MDTRAHYQNRSQYPPLNRVTFRTSDGKIICRDFESPYLAKQFVNKLKHSRRVTLISYPHFV